MNIINFTFGIAVGLVLGFMIFTFVLSLAIYRNKDAKKAREETNNANIKMLDALNLRNQISTEIAQSLKQIASK